jgi:hypothetical protein
LEALEKQIAELKRRNEELQEDNGRRARKDFENTSFLSNQKAQQEEQVAKMTIFKRNSREENKKMRSVCFIGL